MGLDILLAAVGLLIALAIVDLVVGVSNDAANFLNSSLGSRVAPRQVIMIIASLGILTGVVFSSGMMEVARKGIFHPQFFTMPDLMTIFLAVMLTDVLLLDLFNTFGLPTSTTVSIVFELLGAAVVVSILKVIQLESGFASIGNYINTARAMLIISGILLSVAVAFICGACTQFISRLIFTFDYAKRIRRYGALWGGVAMSSITYFILVKGAKGATFSSPASVAWIHDHTWHILLGTTVVAAAILQLLMLVRVNILKPIVLIGTFALALAFAANDLVNFIGVPLAGLHAFQAANATVDPLHVPMEALGGKVHSETNLLFIAGLVMVLTLWLSRKARSVSQTELGLGRQEEGQERFSSTFLSRSVVKMMITCADGISRVVPGRLRQAINQRVDPTNYHATTDTENRPSFDLLRASVNLMVASAVISIATSYKLPLSTTYVTFMVSMGTSFADKAWGRESAVYRVTGVLTVIGGWFLTALAAFTVSGIFALVVHYAGALGVAGLVLLVVLTLWQTHRSHSSRIRVEEHEDAIFNLRKVKDSSSAISTTFSHVSYLLHEMRESFDRALNALFEQNELALRRERNRSRTFQNWVNIIIANVFKSMRATHKDNSKTSPKYAQTIRRLQKIVDGHRDVVMRSYEHVRNHHSGLLDEQVEDLRQVRALLHEILLDVELTLDQKRSVGYQEVVAKEKELRLVAQGLNNKQIERIHDDTSKTRLSILFYAIVGNAMMLAKQNVRLLDIFHESFGGIRNGSEFDLD